MKKKNLKTIFALASGAVLLTALSAFAEGYSDTENDNSLTVSVNALSRLGIINGYEDGSFRPQNQLTREEVCAMLSRMIPQGQSSVITIDFGDVDKKSWSYGAITKAAALSIIDGYEDNTFKPYNNISYQEYIKMIMSMAGYRAYAEDNGGYPDGYIKAAAENKVTDGIEFDFEDDITRRDAAVMLDRILDVPFLLVSTYNVQGISEFKVADGLTYRRLLESIRNLN
ncbi:MAG: S-layer homology domain-containing protein [bacterium]|nr:S-layer homology domain-containing protein [bacterium]